MGLVGAIVGTLGTAYFTGRAQQQQYEAQAAQAEANAKLQAQQAEIAAKNADKANQQAAETAKVNAQNVEMRRRQMLQREGEQRAKIGASNITATGSALNALADSRWDIDMETAMQLYNGQQEVYKMFGQGTDYANQQASHKYNEAVEQNNAERYRAAGKQAFMNSMLGGAFSLAGSLYSSKSSAVQSKNGKSGGFGSITADAGHGVSWNYNTNTGESSFSNKWDYVNGSTYKDYGKINTGWR